MSDIRFTPDRIPELAQRYSDDDSAVEKIGQCAKEAGHYCLEGFLEVCKWKSPRSQPRCRLNAQADVTEITRVALTTSSENLRIGALMCLYGVEWPTASVLLHFAHQDPYPILDVRAIWSLGVEAPSTYSFKFWWKYVEQCRSIARDAGVTMRILDRALWQFSAENQGKLVERTARHEAARNARYN